MRITFDAFCYCCWLKHALTTSKFVWTTQLVAFASSTCTGSLLMLSSSPTNCYCCWLKHALTTSKFVWTTQLVAFASSTCTGSRQEEN